MAAANYAVVGDVNDLWGEESQFAGVEVPAEVATAVVGDRIQPVAEIAEQSLFSKYSTAITDCLCAPDNSLIVSDVANPTGSLLVKIFEDTLVADGDPMCGLPHTSRLRIALHQPNERITPNIYSILSVSFPISLFVCSIKQFVRDNNGPDDLHQSLGDELATKDDPMGQASGRYRSRGWSTKPMYNDTADAENDCGAQARESVFFNEFSDGSVALIDRDGDAGAWLSSDTTVAELEFEIEVQQ